MAIACNGDIDGLLSRRLFYEWETGEQTDRFLFSVYAKLPFAVQSSIPIYVEGSYCLDSLLGRDWEIWRWL